jgi:hypothetical protein
MATEVIEHDDEGIYPDVTVRSTMDEHEGEGHRVERTETLYDNAFEHTEWGWCVICQVEVRIRDVSVADWDAWIESVSDLDDKEDVDAL